tara:strand:- start:2416 stop:3474 length:1059 start_codon:yes stop_codon:yes gene_type:complete
MSTILVTGGAGFVGSHTCVSLLEKGFKVIVVDSNINSSPIALDRVEDILKIKHKSYEKIVFEKGDIRDEIFLRNIFNRAIKRYSEIKAVIHFAGLKSIRESVLDPLSYWDSNLIGTLTLLKVMNDFNCKTIVFSSSASIYGNEVRTPIVETSPIKPNNPYGKTKAAIEKILHDLFISTSNREWRIANLRYFNPIGSHKTGLIGENPNNVPNNLFPLICGVAIGRYEKLNIYGNDWPTKDGTGVRDYIHVMDLAEGHLLVLELLIKNKPQILSMNLGTGSGTSVLELISVFEKINGVKIPYHFSKRREGDNAFVVADNNLAKSILNWEPRMSIQEMCRDGYLWQIKNPNGYLN